MEEFNAGKFAREYASPAGGQLWGILNDPEVIARMETASDLGQPALAPVEDILLEKMGASILQDRYKQCAGAMCRQVMERRGFIHDAYDIRLNSVPFYKSSRYRRADQTGVYLFKSSVDARDICLTDTRGGEKLPMLEQGRWIYVNRVTSRLKATIGYGFDLLTAVSMVKDAGFMRHKIQRITTAA